MQECAGIKKNKRSFTEKFRHCFNFKSNLSADKHFIKFVVGH